MSVLPQKGRDLRQVEGFSGEGPDFSGDDIPLSVDRIGIRMPKVSIKRAAFLIALLAYARNDRGNTRDETATS